jgi:predicted dinucleotide-binding enzyme
VKITIIGRGNVGGALLGLLEANGHDVDALGSDGGDAAGADAVILAVPGGAVEDALRSVSGVEGKILIDATNPLQGRPDGRRFALRLGKVGRERADGESVQRQLRRALRRGRKRRRTADDADLRRR